MDNTIRQWNLATLSQIGQIDGRAESVDTVAIAPDGGFAYSVYGDTLVAADLNSGRSVGSISFDHKIITLSVTPSGRFVAVGDQAGHVHFLGVTTASGA
jgi:WD40 repeat protein